MLSALVVDDDAEARGRVAGLLRLAGWQVHQAAGAYDARRQAARRDPDLLVTDVELLDGYGPDLLRRLRSAGSRARFLVVTADPTPQVRTESADAGSLACLAKPVDERLLLDFLRSRTTGRAAQDDLRPVQDIDDLHDADLDHALMDRLQEMYASALPRRFSAIATGARSGNAPALASAAHALAGTSGQLGHPEVASVCRAIARDARRGILAHSRIDQLQALVGA